MRLQSVASIRVVWSQLTTRKHSLLLHDAKVFNYLAFTSHGSPVALRKFTTGVWDNHSPIASVTTCLQSQRRLNSTVSFEDAIGQEKEKQTRAPWHREGSNVPPVQRARSASAMTKGIAPSGTAHNSKQYLTVYHREAADHAVSTAKAGPTTYNPRPEF